MSLLPSPRTQDEAPVATDYGEVFTRRWVVELILDLCEYTPDRDLAEIKVIDPSCGTGAFFVSVIERLLESMRMHDRDPASLFDAVEAIDIQPQNVATCRQAARSALIDAGVDATKARRLATHWIRQGDFLLEPPGAESADLIVGNPPYIRLEAVAPEVSAAYRQACPAMGGRSDVYIGFYELGLRALGDGGRLGFICADRWMRNAYGARLRDLIGQEWAVEAVINMTGVDAFEEEVSAYPAITVIRRAVQVRGPLIVNAEPTFSASDGDLVVQSAHNGTVPNGANFQAAHLSKWFKGRTGWPHGSPKMLAAIADMEMRLPTLEDAGTGTKVGIGLATGADRVFITTEPDVVEKERLLPLAMVRDIADGSVQWSGRYLVNPWTKDGLIDLDEWPRFSQYLGAHRKLLAKRHTARSGNWHRTIDRVVPGLAEAEKLYLPDFKETLFPVIDHGSTYPHHNLYWITSGRWDLEVLGGILLSEIANLFVSAYSVRMRGGYLRFQAQYLRRIRLPHLDNIYGETEELLRSAFRTRDRTMATEVSLPLYGLSSVPAQ